MARKKYDVIAIGEAGLDTFVKLDSASLLCTLDTDRCLLCLNYGDKITIEEMQETLAHNACNFSVGSARLGLRAALYANVGGDDIGKKVVKLLAKEGVASRYLKVQKSCKSNHSVVLNYKAERTILVYREPHTYTLPRLDTTEWIYLTSLGKGFEKLHRQLLVQVRANGFRLAFNPGDMQLRAGMKALKPILQICSVLILNKQEAQNLLGSADEKKIPELLRELSALGPKIVVITNGTDGAYAFDGKRAHRARSLPAHPIEMTGAGDSFSTGFIAALISGKTLEHALLWGSTNAASVIEHVGPQEGLLTRQQLLKRLKKT